MNDKIVDANGVEAKVITTRSVPDAFDPVADLLSANDLMPKADSVEEWMRRVKSLKFCSAKKEYDNSYEHDNCTTLADIDAALVEAKKLGVSIKDVISTKNSAPQIMALWLYQKACHRDCLIGKEVEYTRTKGDEQQEADCIENRQDVAAYILDRVAKLEVPSSGTLQRRLDVPELWFEWKKNHWWIKTGQRWIAMNESATVRKLMQCGLSPVSEARGLLSEVAHELLRVQDNNAVEWAGELAGYPSGLLPYNGRRALVTVGTRLMTPVEGRWPVLTKIFRGLLGDQRWWFYFWIKLFAESLVANQSRPGQCMILCGPRDAMKSFVQHRVLTPLFGGREADASRYLFGKTDFNADLAAAEHLYLDDAKPYGSFMSRHDFAENLKALIVGKAMSVHGKHQDAENMSPRQRVTMSLNDDEDAIRNLPELTESFEDKCILLRCMPFGLPLPNGTLAERQQFEDTVAQELPHFLHWLLSIKVARDYQGVRFGLRHYHNPELVRKAVEISPEMEFAGLIDMAGLTPNNEPWVVRDYGRAWIGTAEELKQRLLTQRSTRALAERTLSWKNATGSLLGKLEKAMPEKVAKWHHPVNEDGGQTWRRDWIIRIPGQRKIDELDAEPC